jgi:hypothetical protein
MLHLSGCINDPPDYIKHSQIRLFADDSIIYRPIKTQADCIKLQEDLESAVKWMILKFPRKNYFNID